MSIAPPRPKGPHLNALRAFEAAARLGSFSAAAEELSVTPGAVTQHIKTLEAWAETPLFVRNPRGITLTPLAEDLLPGFTLAFDQLGVAVQVLRSNATPKKIKVAALPSIAQLWLAPKLGELRQHAPDISISVIAMETPPNLTRDLFDMAIFFSSDPLGPNEFCIVADRIFPVCTPSIAARLNTLSDLTNETLIHDGVWGNDWDIWLKSQPGTKGIGQTGTVHSLYSIALEEARHGGGVLIAHESLVQPHLENGDLVRPFDMAVELPQKMIASVTPAFKESLFFDGIRSVLFGSP